MSTHDEATGASRGSWFDDPTTLIAELQRARGARPAPPAIAGYDELRELRRGGQGVVFSAVQRSTRRRVAVKVLLHGALASGPARRRFEREIEAVAGLRHPNVVRIYDSGATGDGAFPYFVMEYVEGLPIDQHCRDVLCVSPGGPPRAFRAFAGLMVKVADAVNHAHQRGVIHRDLKPSNIRVDASGEPRVLDFGLAKSGEGAEQTAVSASGQFVGSLPWASPEQAEGNPERIDLRTDVYSLGAIMYQAVTGSYPCDPSGSLRTGLRNIVAVEPRPAHVLSPGLDRDFSTIIGRCLAKEPGRRYQTAGELKRDLDRYLAGEAIEARADSRWYLLSRAVRRHRLLVGSAAAIVATLAVALAVSVHLLSVAQRERDEGEASRRAARIAESEARAQAEAAALARDEALLEASQRAETARLMERMLVAADPGRDGREVKIADVLDRFAAELDAERPEAPLVEASARSALGGTYAALGLYERAERQLLLALEIRRRELGPDHADVLDLLDRLPPILVRQGRRDEGLAMAGEAVEAATRALGAGSREALRARARLGETLAKLERYAEAEPVLREALGAQSATLGESHVDCRASMNVLALALKYLGRSPEAEALYARSAGYEEEIRGPDHPMTLSVLANLALAKLEQGSREKLAESEAIQRRVLEARERVLGPGHPETLESMSNLATLLIDVRKLEEAEQLLRRADEASTRREGPEHHSTLVIRNNLAKTIQDLGRPGEAEPIFREVYEIRRRTLGPGAPSTLLSGANYAVVLAMQEKFAEAAPLQRENLEARVRVLGPDDLSTLISSNNLGQTLSRLERFEEALGYLEAAARGAERTRPPGDFIAGLFRGNYGRCLLALGRIEEARAELEASYTILSAAFGDADRRTQQAVRNLVEIAERRKDEAAAEAWRGKLVGEDR